MRNTGSSVFANFLANPGLWNPVLTFAFVMVLVSAPALAQQENPYVGQIDLTPSDTPPDGWAFCHGQLLNLSQHTALFSLLGTTYGGDGKNNFALPNLQDHIAIGVGQGDLLYEYALGAEGGSNTHFLQVSELPAHIHEMNADSTNGTSHLPTGKYLAKNSAGVPTFGTLGTASMSMLATTGSGAAINTMQPYLRLRYIIAMEGIFPPPH